MAKKHHKQSKTNDTLGEQICNANHRQELVSLIYKELLKLEGECSGGNISNMVEKEALDFPSTNRHTDSTTVHEQTPFVRNPETG